MASAARELIIYFRQLRFFIRHPSALRYHHRVAPYLLFPFNIFFSRLAYYLVHPKNGIRRIFGSKPDFLEMERDRLNEVLVNSQGKSSASQIEPDPFRSAISISYNRPNDTPHAIRLLLESIKSSSPIEHFIHLAHLLIQRNLMHEATRTYQAALRQHPADSHLIYLAGIHFMRHENEHVILEHFRAARTLNPDEELSELVINTYEYFAQKTEELDEELRSLSDITKPDAIGVCSVWGKGHIEQFLNYSLASLLCPGNLPDMSRKLKMRVYLFTDSKGQSQIRAHNNFLLAKDLIDIVFIDMPPDIKRALKNNKGITKNIGKFIATSGIQYTLLEVARRSKLVFWPIPADNLFSASFLSTLNTHLTAGVLAVCGAEFRLYGHHILPIIDACYRTESGAILFTDADAKELLAKYEPRQYLHNSENFTKFPIHLSFIHDNEMIIFCNHYMPYWIDAGALQHPIELSIDPLDGRFLSRLKISADAISLLRNASGCAFDVGPNPLVEQNTKSSRYNPDKMARWLLSYWDTLRAFYTQTPIHILNAPSTPEYKLLNKAASDIIQDVLSRVDAQQEENRALAAYFEQLFVKNVGVV